MLTYLDANLHPQQYTAGALLGSPAATLRASIVVDHEPRADVDGGEKIALAWLGNSKLHALWHNGGTGGYSAFAGFNPDQGSAVVVLYNRFGDSRFFYFMDRVGENVLALLSGEPALPLDFMCEADKRALAHLGIQQPGRKAPCLKPSARGAVAIWPELAATKAEGCRLRSGQPYRQEGCAATHTVSHRL